MRMQPEATPSATAATATTARHSASPWALLRQAVGGKAQRRDKAKRIVATARIWLDKAEVEARLAALQRRGFLERAPTRLQLLVGGFDQLRFVIVPASRDYYATQGISFWMHQVLRFLDDPVSVLDPTGLFSTRETIMGHVMQVVHLDPVYDLELLQMFDDGLEVFEAEIVAMIDGSHPRAATIGAIVEDADYHRRLLAYVRAYRADPSVSRLARPLDKIGADAHFRAAARQFAAMPGYFAWCNALPSGVAGLAWHRLRVRRFPLAGVPLQG